MSFHQTLTDLKQEHVENKEDDPSLSCVIKEEPPDSEIERDVEFGGRVPVDLDRGEIDETRGDKAGHNSNLTEDDDDIVVEGEDEFSCGVCGDTFLNLPDLEKHMYGHVKKTKQKNFHCKECGRDFMKESALVRHLRWHTGEKPFVCSVCNKTFRESFFLTRHMRRHKKSGSARQCAACERVDGESPHELIVHTCNKAFDCKICDRRLTSSYNLKQHMRIHTGERPFSCVICQIDFAQNGTLKRHVERYHNQKEKHKCTHCDMNLATSYDLCFHMKTHTGERIYQCDLCDKKFAQAYSLKIHKNIHKGVTPYTCEICKKGFALPSKLKRHMFSHTKKQHFVCDICSKAYTQPNGLNQHGRRNMSVGPYTCRDCQDSFPLASGVDVDKTRHNRSKAAKKKYLCSECGKMFSDGCYLRQHETSVHKKNKE